MECRQENTAVECVVRGGGGGGEESGVDLEVISWQIHHGFFVLGKLGPKTRRAFGK